MYMSNLSSTSEPEDAKQLRAIDELNFETLREKKCLRISVVTPQDQFSGSCDQNPYMDLGIVEKVIKEKKYEVLQKTKSYIKIQVFTAVITLNSTQSLRMKEIEDKVEVVPILSQTVKKLDEQVKNLEDYNTELKEALPKKKNEETIEELKTQNQSLQDQIKNLKKQIQQRPQWIEQDLNSTDNFDQTCIYKMDFTNNNQLMSVSIEPSILYFMRAGSNYSTSSDDRKKNSVGWTPKKLWKMKIA